jgi:hypothetical protein
LHIRKQHFSTRKRHLIEFNLQTVWEQLKSEVSLYQNIVKTSRKLFCKSSKTTTQEIFQNIPESDPDRTIRS